MSTWKATRRPPATSCRTRPDPGISGVGARGRRPPCCRAGNGASNTMESRGSRRLRAAGALVGALVAMATVTATGLAPSAAAQARQWYLGPMQAQRMWKTGTGKGVKVAVIDSGVNADTPALKGQVLIDEVPEAVRYRATDDYTGNGTTMAELIAGTGAAVGSRASHRAPRSSRIASSWTSCAPATRSGARPPTWRRRSRRRPTPTPRSSTSPAAGSGSRATTRRPSTTRRRKASCWSPPSGTESGRSAPSPFRPGSRMCWE